jgi:Fe-S oxidoreductase
VDVAKLKAEFLQQYYDANGVPFRTKLIANFSAASKIGAWMPAMYNFMATAPIMSTIIKKVSGFSTARSLPTLHSVTLEKWNATRTKNAVAAKRKVYFFCDEFTNYNDTLIGQKAILLLEKLGYEVVIPKHLESSRTWLSKGLIRKAKTIVNENIQLLKGIVSAETPMIGVEPSAILTFRDEYIDLATDENFTAAKQLSENVFTIDEFIAAEIKAGNIVASMFTNVSKKIMLHGHCQQKALSALSDTVSILSLPANYQVETIPSGCCGMAGSFGYEKEHYEVSMQIGELVLFPAVRKQSAEVIIAAPGTSCRHQIKDGTQRQALHPVEILFDALV